MAMDFAPRKSIEQVEEGTELAPKFDAQGLIPAVTTDFESGELLMQGYMNAEALRKTIETGEAHYFSRSRGVLWHKGATSGLVQNVRELLSGDGVEDGVATALGRALEPIVQSGDGTLAFTVDVPVGSHPPYRQY